MKRTITWGILALLLLILAPAGAENDLRITTETLPNAMAGTFYNTKIEGVCEGEKKFALAYTNEGTTGCPAGLKLTHSGTLYGNPAAPGTYTFSVCLASGTKDVYKNFTLTVLPFDESRLNRGGTNQDIIGTGLDSVVGVANALQGGNAAMDGDKVFFINKKGYLMQSEPPYKKAAKRFNATEYRMLDAFGGSLYYYQRYLEQRGTSEDLSDSKYTTRIAGDPLGVKGRATLMSLSQKEASCLSAAEKTLLFIKGDKNGVMTRVPFEGQNGIPMHVYYGGHELYAESVIPYKGFAYFKAEQDGRVYRCYLDGELCSPVTEDSVTSYTIAVTNGMEVLCYADAKGDLYAVSLEGQMKTRLKGLNGSHLNADETYLYFTDSNNKNRPTRVNLSLYNGATALSDLSADQLYVFDGHLVFHKAKSREFYLMEKTPGAEAIRLNKD